MITKTNSIPISMWWAIVTLTTVGYGDEIPQHPFGKVWASFTMLIGTLVIALPVAIVGNKFHESFKEGNKITKKTYPPKYPQELIKIDKSLQKINLWLKNAK